MAAVRGYFIVTAMVCPSGCGASVVAGVDLGTTAQLRLLLMDIIKISYSGRITAGLQKRTNFEHSVPPKSEEQQYMELVHSVYGLEKTRELRAHMGLSNVPNSAKVSEPCLRKPRGRKGISSFGRSIVRDSACYLEETFGRGRLSFLTLTIPPEALELTVVQQWSRVSELLLKRLSYRLRKAQLPGLVVGVTELQESRRNREGIELPGLHLHLLFVGRSAGGHWAIAPHDVDRMWEGILSRVVGHAVPVPAACKIQPVRRSAYGYLGKYLSKGVSSLQKHNPEHLPPSWYICTLLLRRIVKKLKVSLQGAPAKAFFQYLEKNFDIFSFQKKIELTAPSGRLIPVGWYGQLRSRYDYGLLVEMSYELRAHFSS